MISSGATNLHPSLSFSFSYSLLLSDDFLRDFPADLIPHRCWRPCACAVFSDCWQALLNDVTNLAKEVSELLQGRATEKHVYMSLPRPGVSIFIPVVIFFPILLPAAITTSVLYDGISYVATPFALSREGHARTQCAQCLDESLIACTPLCKVWDKK